MNSRVSGQCLYTITIVNKSKRNSCKVTNQLVYTYCMFPKGLHEKTLLVGGSCEYE